MYFAYLPTYIYYNKDLAFNYYEPGKGAITEQGTKKFN